MVPKSKRSGSKVGKRAVAVGAPLLLMKSVVGYGVAVGPKGAAGSDPPETSADCSGAVGGSVAVTMMGGTTAGAEAQETMNKAGMMSDERSRHVVMMNDRRRILTTGFWLLTSGLMAWVWQLLKVWLREPACA